MSNSKDTILSYYGNRIRVRACGIAQQNDCLLLVNHANLNESGNFWNPPGGGISENETAVEALKREFLEECGVPIEVGKLLFINELIKYPLHGIELIFEVKLLGKSVKKGHDPELPEQIIQSVEWVSWKTIEQLSSADKPSYLESKKEFLNRCLRLF